MKRKTALKQSNKTAGLNYLALIRITLSLLQNMFYRAP
jgi:hypothetical protein